mgnify:FL=1
MMKPDDVKLVELNDDKRGFLKLMGFGDYEALVSFTVKDKSRSGYFFKVDRVYVVILGSFLYRVRNMKDGAETEKIIRAGDYFTVKPGNAHVFTALEDSYMIEFTPNVKEKIEMIPYEPYRKICEKDV